MSWISTCLYCFRLVNTNDGLLCEKHYAEELKYERKIFFADVFDIIFLELKRVFDKDESLIYKRYKLDYCIYLTYSFMPKEDINYIMKLSIINLYPDDDEDTGNYPYAILNMLYDMGFKFNGELYELTRSDECSDSGRILELFCNEPARTIQRAWRQYCERKRNRASQIIQQKVREWLYRPGGPMMKKFEEHFNQLAVTHTN